MSTQLITPKPSPNHSMLTTLIHYCGASITLTTLSITIETPLEIVTITPDGSGYLHIESEFKCDEDQGNPDEDSARRLIMLSI